MQETEASEIELGEMEGPVLQALVSHMYGKLSDIEDHLVLSLFMAADAHQVCLLNFLFLHSLDCIDSFHCTCVS